MNAKRKRPVRGAPGFTLVESMMVLLMLGILMAVAIPNFVSHQNKGRSETAAEDLASRIRLTRQKAIARRAQYRLLLNPAAGEYQLQRRVGVNTWTDDPPEVFTLPTGVTFNVDLGGDPSNLDLVLDPQGTVNLADVPATIRLDGVEDTLSISVVRTGRIRVSRGS